MKTVPNKKVDNRVESAPKVSGVYLMKDDDGKVMYIGKAKNLRSRVQSYFRKKGDGRFSVAVLRDKVKTVEYLTTASDKEALLLEDKLIKQYQPKYNIDLKDDSSYSSIKLTIREKYPRLLVVHKRKDDGSLYFGPFTSAAETKKMVKKLREKYKLRRCKGDKPQKDGPCLYAQIDGCCAPCAGGTSLGEYREKIKKIISSLRRAELMEISCTRDPRMLGSKCGME